LASTGWTQGFKPEEKENFLQALSGSRTVLDRLEQLLLQELEELTRLESSLEIYENPSWSHAQAHRNGIVAHIRKMLTLIKRT
jgi:hypothetical protein